MRGGGEFAPGISPLSDSMEEGHVIHDLIYDVGMNNGDDTAYYLHRGFRVVAVDANPQACATVSQRFQGDLDNGRLTILNTGITAEPGRADFWVCETHPEWSSFQRPLAARDASPHRCVQVPCRTFDSILEQYGVPYYLKVDIEGNDLLCIHALRTQTDLPRYLSLETDRIDESVQALASLGYTGYKCISQFHFLPLQLPPVDEQRQVEFWYRLLTRRTFPLRLFRRAVGQAGRDWMAGRCSHARRQGDWVFPEGASGSFGEDTRGRWLTGDEVRQVYHHYEEARQRGLYSPFWNDKGYSFWTDLHARRDR